MKNLLILSIILLLTNCRINTYVECTQLYYTVDSSLVNNAYQRDTFWIEAVHEYTTRKIKTQNKPIKLN
jgi:hypothetical protein